MAEVHLAREPLVQGLNKILVIKQIHRSLAQDSQFRQMFEDEARVAVNLNHPNVVQTFGYGHIDQTFYIAMEYVEGVDLLRLMNGAAALGERVPIGLVAYIVQQISKGLDYAHRKTDEYGEPLNIVHRDISPQNVLISFDGSVKIVDFGIARSRHAREDEGVVKGKFAYMSPEQASGEPVDPRADIFSTGVLLWELICARTLFGHYKGKQALDAIRAVNVVRPRAIDPTIPEELEEIVMRCLQRRPENRFSTARDLQRALGLFFVQVSAREGQIYDSGSLAAFIARVIPKETRALVEPPPKEEPSRGLAESQLLPVGEQRQIVLVSVNVSGTSALRRQGGAGSDEADRLAEALQRRIGETAQRFEAHVERLDERGAVLLLGVPLGKEDEALRGIRLGLTLLDEIAALSQKLDPPLRIAVGIAMGTCLIARGATPAPGSTARPYDYEVQSSALQLANRLASEAIDGEILVSDRLYRAARSEFRFEELGAVAIGEASDGSVLGQAKTYRLTGARPRGALGGDRVPARLFGRERELAELRQICDATVQSGRAHHVVLLGEIGVGKRTLVDAFRRSLDPEQHLVAHARARQGRRDTPYSLVADLLRDALGVADDTDPREVRRRVLGAVNKLFRSDEPEATLTSDALLRLLAQQLAPQQEELEPAERRRRLHVAMREIERRIAGHRLLLIVLEDYHWVDDASFEILTALIRDPVASPVMVVLTAREDERTGSLKRSSRLHKILVGELDPKAREELVLDRFAQKSDALQLAPRLLEHTGGNPFYIEEQLESLVERGVLGRVDPSDPHSKLVWQRRDEQIAIPSSLGALIGSRIDRLPVEERDVIRRAALWGRAFSIEDIAVLCDGDRRNELERLVGRGLLVPAADGVDERGPTRFEFRNLITKEVAYAGLGPDARALLHSVAADRMQRSAQFRRGVDDAQLAEHLAAAGDGLAAGQSLLAAAAFARAAADGTEALRLLDRALELLPLDAYEERYLVHSERELLLRGAGDRAGQQRESQAMQKMAVALADRRRESEAHARAAQMHLETGKYPAARREIDRALKLARDVGEPLAESEALRIEAMLLSSIGKNQEAEERAARALQVLPKDERPETTTLRAHALSVLGLILLHTGRLLEAAPAFTEALEIHRALGQRRLEAATLNNMGWVAVGLGRYEEALLHYKRSLKLAQDLGDRLGVGIRLANLGQTCTELGDWERGQKYLDKAILLQESLGDVAGLADALISRAQVALRKHDWEAAAADLERGLEYAAQTRNRYQEVRALVYQALCRLWCGRAPEGARELARSASRLAAESSIANGEAYGLGAEALAELALRRPQEALKCATRALQLIEGGRNVDSPEEVLYWHAQVARAAGAVGAAVDSARRAAALVERKAAGLSDGEWRQRYVAAEPQRGILELARELGVIPSS